MNERKMTLGLFALTILLGSLLMAFSIVGNNFHSAYASGITTQDFSIPAGEAPWGTTFDSNGHVWLAIPGCDPAPTCNSNTPPGKIAEYNPSSSSWMKTYQLPSGYAQPLFLAFDTQGRLWFPMPMDNALGMFNPGNNAFQQWTVPTANAGPWGVAVDLNGKVWFTEHFTNKIGCFDPVTQKFVEVSTPASNSQPYGIVVDASNNVWFAENNPSVALVGEYTSGGQLQEFKIRDGSTNGLTPHQITVDPNGNIWWSEGWVGMIGELKVAQAVPGTKKGVTEYAYQKVCSNCSTHTSGISVDRNGLIWFDDSEQNIFGSFPDSGSGSFTIYNIPTANSHPYDGLNVDGQNRIWFNEEFANKLAEAIQSGVPTPTVSPSLTPTPPPVSGPVSKVWYFAEGRAGAGFKEFLTMGNPTTNPCQVKITYLTQPDRGPAGTKTVSVSVPAAHRVTEWVDGDLGTAPSGPGISDAATVSVDTTATPKCSGIVAERPMYFSALGTTGGSDVVGVTHTGTTYYFADLPVGSQPGGGNSSSFLPILNPGATAAAVTATYYAHGQQVGSQALTVAPHSRGTLFPSQATPSRVSVVLSSSQPVVSERPTYFSGITGCTAGRVSGGADVIGVASLSRDWLFAEGYTGGHFQQYFVLANLDPAKTPAAVTITLEYDDGTAHAFPVTVNPLSQVVWNVNTAGTGATSQAVSAEIKSSGANIVVERELYFGYDHVGDGRTTRATGGTDVLGQVGPAGVSAYSFAEGYTNLGYDEWLTIQNPTPTSETITVTVANAVGTLYTFSVQVLGHSRYTVDMVAVVMQHLYHPTDGYNGYEISLAVHSSNGPCVVERPMYWNASGTLGGSDVIGYAGG